MKTKDFEASIKAQVNRCMRTLVDKGEEYATDDPLHNFRRAAELKGETLEQACVGMMVKHTVSIFDMVTDKEEHTIEAWREKIGDNINYLLLLSAILDEKEAKKEKEL